MQYRLNGAMVAISKQQVDIDTAGTSDLKKCRQEPIQNASSIGTRIPLVCDTPLEGRYVTIYIPMIGILTLCEVQVLKGKSLSEWRCHSYLYCMVFKQFPKIQAASFLYFRVPPG